VAGSAVWLAQGQVWRVVASRAGGDGRIVRGKAAQSERVMKAMLKMVKLDIPKG